MAGIGSRHYSNPKGYTMNVEEIVFDMLRENTGRHMCDSGGAYGRNWERNQSLTIEACKQAPTVTYEHKWGYTIDVFQYLVNRLTLDDLCERFNTKCVPASDWDSDYYGVSRNGERWLKAAGLVPHHEFSSAFNTYNHESNLSQILQGEFLSHQDSSHESYVLLQIHGGCDARGGYTDARLFECDPYEFLCENVYGAVIKPDGTEIRVSNTYDGYKLTCDDDDSDTYGYGEEVEIGEDDKVELECLG